MTKFKIENIPVVMKSDSKPYRLPYPVDKLEVGQSFKVYYKNYVNISAFCYNWSRKLNKKFRATKEKGFIRIGRLQ